ncbi:unnamed protein product [Rhizophagus irregularis]|nr:unnamed protein product [Rhizophagus irregularis]
MKIKVKKWIEKKLENEYIHYFKYDEFKIDEEEIGRGRDIRILMVLSMKLLWVTFWRFFCIFCDGQAFGHMKFPMTGQTFGLLNSGIGYWNLEIIIIEALRYPWRLETISASSKLLVIGQIVFWSP